MGLIPDADAHDHQIDNIGTDKDEDQRVQSRFQGKEDGSRYRDQAVKDQHGGSQSDRESFQEDHLNLTRPWKERFLPILMIAVLP